MRNELAPGARLGRWSLQDRLGAGAFATTWRAIDPEGRLAAIKVLDAAPGDELRALSRICHPAVVAVLDGGVHPLPFLAMELAPGRPLTSWLEAGLDEAQAAAVTAVLADALATVHHAGIIHGDLKPDNVVCAGLQPPALAIVDFGLAGRAGGTLAWASPEAAAGRPATTRSDVYALGLLLWVMLHGNLPWSELGPSMSLVRRRSSAPKATRGAVWLRELLSRMLAVDPMSRPSAEAVADVFVANGYALAAPDPGLLRRRAPTATVPRPEVDAAVADWLEQGGRLALVGPSGSGRTHALGRIADELRARGRRWLRLGPGGFPWAPVVDALASPDLPGPPTALPADADPGARANAAAAELEARADGRLHVLIDDLDELDPGTRATVEALATRGRADLVGAGPTAPAWAELSASLSPLDANGLRALYSGALGAAASLDALVERALAVSGGLPGPAVEFLVAAAAAGAVVRRAHRWVEDELRLTAVALGEDLAAGLDRQLSPDAAALGAVIAIADLPIAQAAAAALAELHRDEAAAALHELVGAGLVTAQGERLRCRSRAAARALIATCAAPERVHQAFVAHQEAARPVPFERLGWHLVGSKQPDLVARLGPSALAAARRLDPTAASPLADALWSLAPVPALAAERIESLAAAGRAEDALAIAAPWLEGARPGAEQLPVLLVVARIEAIVRGQDAAALRAITAAREIVGDAPDPAVCEAEAVVHSQAKRWDEAIAAASKAATGAPPGDPDGIARWLRLHGLWAQAVHKRDRVEAAIGILDRLPPQVGRGTTARALLDGMRGRLLWHAGRLHEAGRAMAEAAEARGLPAVDRAGLMNNAALVRYQTGDLTGALASWETALLLFERMAATRLTVPVLVNLCLGYAEAGRWDRAVQSGERAARLAATLGDAAHEAMAWGNLGDVHLSRDALEAADACFERAVELADAHGLAGERIELARRRAELALRRGDPDGLERARLAERRADEASATFEACRAAALVAVGSARIGDLESMHDAARRAIAPLQQAGAARELAVVRLSLAEAYASIGLSDDAAGELARVVAYADEVGNVPLRTRADAIAARTSPPGFDDQRLELIVDLAVAVGKERDLPTLLDAIARAALDLLRADRSFVLLVDGEGPRVAAARTRAGVTPGQPSMTVVRRALSGNREVIAADVGERSDLRVTDSVTAMALRSVMCVPLAEGDTTLGAIYVDSHTASEQELSQAARFLRALAAHAAIAVQNARHLSQAAQRAHHAAEIAHDLRNPAGVVVAISDELLLLGQQADLKEIGDDLRAVGERLLGMARQFLEGEGAGRQPVEVSALTARVGTQIARLARKAGVVTEVVLADPAWLQGRSHDLERALLNLVGNALQHSARGAVIRLELSVEPRTVTWIVRDQGPGVDPQLGERSFERGVRGAFAPSGGYGLGLAIVRRVAEEHGGQVSAGNHPDGGAVFRLVIPRP